MSDKEISSFVFSMHLAKESKNDLQSKVDSLKSRIDHISSNILVNDVPIIAPILSITRSKEDLKKLAKALDRLADIVQLLDSLEQKLHVIEMAEKDPNWFVSTFGDFSNDVDQTIDKILKDTL